MRTAAPFALALLPLAAALAQDSRTVTEPRIPAACVSLDPQAADETKPDSARIQSALDHCGAGKAVELKAGVYYSGPIQLRTGVTLLIGEGATLNASRNPREYDLQPGSCGTVTKTGHGCKPFISASNVQHASIMGGGVIDGRGGAKLEGQNVTWWDLAQEAKVKNENQSCPRILIASHADDFTLYRITLKNSPNFHVSYSGNGFTAWGVIIDSPKESRNTDGIDPANATNVTITHCFIHAGDDDIAIKAGGSNNPPATHMTISHNHFYSGHGMSIGSETNGGASAIRVSDLTIDGADNGLRIKSNSTRGGLVRDIVYEDVCIRDTKNPILMDSTYSATGLPTNVPSNKLPHFTDIVLRNVHILSPGTISLMGFDATHRLGMTFDNVIVDSRQMKYKATEADLTFGPGPVNLQPTGNGVKIIGAESDGPGYACGDRFVPMPKK